MSKSSSLQFLQDPISVYQHLYILTVALLKPAFPLELIQKYDILSSVLSCKAETWSTKPQKYLWGASQVHYGFPKPDTKGTWIYLL